VTRLLWPLNWYDKRVTDTYRSRLADRALAQMVAAHAALLVVGPRATGKTTTAQRLAGSSVRLADRRVAAAVAADPQAVLGGMTTPVLIDEWQIVPECLNAVKEQVDTDPRRGQFIVTGSVRGDLDSPTWPGTGRLVRLPMYGLTEREVEGRIDAPGWLHRVLAGERFTGFWTTENIRTYVGRALRSGFPEPALQLETPFRHQWLTSYVDQLITRDAAGVDRGRDPQRLRRYLAALALNSAGIVDDTTLWTSAQINKATARAYDTLLQNLLVVENVPAWTSNRLKRLTLAPKRYLIDCGLFAGVLGATPDDIVLDADLLGRVLDTFVAAQLRAELALSIPQRALSHLRQADGRREVDIIVELGPRRIAAIEVKATSAPGPHDARHLRWLRREMGDDLAAAVLLHTGPAPIQLDDDVLALPIATLWA
jgi:uncharacterized protein